MCPGRWHAQASWDRPAPLPGSGEPRGAVVSKLVLRSPASVTPAPLAAGLWLPWVLPKLGQPRAHLTVRRVMHGAGVASWKGSRVTLQGWEEPLAE